MASVSSTSSSLSSTLQGYGGLASGIDRDSIIEQMTSGTTAKITKLEKQKDELEWKQEAYRGLSDKVLDLQDNYLSYSSSFNIKNSSSFAKSMLTALGDSDVTQFVSASGTSSMIDYLSIVGVSQLATSATLLSKEKTAGVITTGKALTLSDDNKIRESKLEGTKLTFGKKYGDFSKTFTFDSSYTDDNGDTVEIDYLTKDKDKLAEQLNTLVKKQDFQLDDKTTIYFLWDSTNDMMNIQLVNRDKTNGGAALGSNNKPTEVSYNINGYVINKSSSALSALGYDSAQREAYFKEIGKSGEELTEAMSEGISIFGADKEYGYKSTSVSMTKGFTDSYVTETKMQDYLVGKKLTVTYGGQSAEIELLTKDDVTEINKLTKDAEKTEYMADAIQKRIDKAFGSGKVSVTQTGGKLSFEDVSNNSQTLTINASDLELRNILGIEKNQSNKLSADASLLSNGYEFLGSNGQKLGAGEALNITINGVTLSGVTTDTTVNELLSKINNNKEIGVKASYMSGTGQLVLVAESTGSGREITLGGDAGVIFGGTSKDGEDAVMEISYGNGVNQTLTSSSNTFQIDGVKINVSGTFGYKKNENGEFIKDASGNLQVDTTEKVTFKSSADTEKIVENVKKFVEEYNALVEAIYKETTTKPDSDYGALSDDERDAMSDSEIEKWEKKAKEGLLYSDSTIRSLYSDLQALSSKILTSGISYDDLEAIGISFSDTRADYGKLIFDETKFKEAVESDPELVSDIFTGGGDVKTGLAQLIEDTLTPYATRYATKNGNSYGKLIEEAGSEKLVLSTTDNYIYKQLKEMDEQIKTWKARLESEQDRYIQQFTNMESMISQYNTQASYISGLSG